MSDSGTVRRDWDSVELAETVNTYLKMLELELSAVKYSKASFRRALKPLLINRSEAAIEFKFQNVSAVLIRLGWLPITGYKPKFNYQQALALEVASQLKISPQIDVLTNKLFQTPPPVPQENEILIESPIPALSELEIEAWIPREKEIVRDYIKIDAARKDLGLAGELSVLNFEKLTLTAFGKADLADEVEHSSVTLGDGLGYDIRSFSPNGDEKFIEVKTTVRSADWPFFLTKNELSASKFYDSRYFLYRLFNFGSKPKFYSIKGDLSLSCSLSPELYSGLPKNSK